MENAKKFSWDEYFGTTEKVTQTLDGKVLYNSTGTSNFYINLCNFEDCKEKGAIRIERDNEICALLEESTFKNCSSDSQGGSLFFNCVMNGQFVQRRNIFHSSKAKNCIAFGQAVKSGSSCKNYAFDISVSKCGESESTGHWTIAVAYGNNRIANSNITSNKCIERSSLHSYLNGDSGICNFSIFAGNNQTESDSIRFENGYFLNQIVTYCNVVGNKCGINNNQVLFYCERNTYVDHCTFLNNIAVYMFCNSNENFLLSVSDSCVESMSTSGAGSVTFPRYNESCLLILKGISNKIAFLSEIAKTSTTPHLISLKK